jgi:hypothetical protein
MRPVMAFPRGRNTAACRAAIAIANRRVLPEAGAQGRGRRCLPRLKSSFPEQKAILGRIPEGVRRRPPPLSKRKEKEALARDVHSFLSLALRHCRRWPVSRLTRQGGFRSTSCSPGRHGADSPSSVRSWRRSFERTRHGPFGSARTAGASGRVEVTEGFQSGASVRGRCRWRTSPDQAALVLSAVIIG